MSVYSVRQLSPGGQPSGRVRTVDGYKAFWSWCVPGTLSLSALAGLLALLGQRGYDDPYITYRYASNLMTGQGLVYNVGQRTLSTTTPLYAMLLAASGLTGARLPTISNIVCVVAIVLLAGLLVAWGRHRGEVTTGMVAATLLGLSPLLLMTVGSEFCLYLMLIVAGFYAAERSHLSAAAIVLAPAAMVRPDGVLAGIVLAAWWFVRHRRLPWQPVVLYLALIGTWYLGLWSYYGSPIPLTLLAKQQQARLEGSQPFAVALWRFVGSLALQPTWWLHGALALFGIVQVATKARHWALLLGWTVAFLFAYSILGISAYSWYFAALAPAFAVLVAEGAMALIRRLARSRLPRAVLVSAVLLVSIGLIAPQLSSTLSVGRHSDPRLGLYREIGEWLNTQTPPTATVATLEVGIIGYYAQRPMIDFAGLIQPEVARQLGTARTYLGSATWAIQRYWPEYVVMHHDGFAGLGDAHWFRAAYAPTRDFADETGMVLRLYRRRKSS
jgi:hypothetical protein